MITLDANVSFSTLAGSTIMLLTIAWGGSLFLGRCDLDSNGEAIEETGEGINCRNQVRKILQNCFGNF